MDSDKKSEDISVCISVKESDLLSSQVFLNLRNKLSNDQIVPLISVITELLFSSRMHLFSNW